MEQGNAKDPLRKMFKFCLEKQYICIWNLSKRDL